MASANYQCDDLGSSAKRKRPAPRGTASYPRKRAVTACQVCRARRTKCDNLKPSCSFCIKSGATCVQSSVDLSSFDPASLKILESLDEVKALLRLEHTDNHVEAESSERTRQISATKHIGESPDHYLQVPTSEEILEWPIFRDMLHSTPSGRRLQFPVAETSRTPAVVVAMLAESPHYVNKLVDNFYLYMHVKNPITDETATRTLVSTAIVEGIDWSPTSCLALLICAVGSVSTPFGPSDSTCPGETAYTDSQALFRAAERRLGELMTSRDLIAAQCFFLAGVYMMCMLEQKKAWRFFLQALAACQELPAISSRASANTSFGRQINDSQYCRNKFDIICEANYWSAWKSEREIRCALRYPDFKLRDQEVDIYPLFFPTPPSFDESFAEREVNAWYFYLSEISLRRLASRISGEILALHRGCTSELGFLLKLADEVPIWELQIQEWVKSLPLPMSLAAPEQEDDVCRFILRGHLVNVYEMLYWNFVRSTMPVSGKLEDITASMSHDIRLLHYAGKGMEMHVDRFRVNKRGFKHRHHGTILMIQSCVRSALVLLCAAICNRNWGYESNCTIRMPQEWREGVEQVVELLGHWEGENRDLVHIRETLEQTLRQV
ncbi:hypothetical protein BX600DRAFT_477110 [Xylariales sp. PMI_506]|nr:hypothetical protein BX600DRAFT_477110 [Xylariales sp. PMI_506]